MPNGYRNGAYAIGLISGIGLTLNLVFWLDYRAQDQKHQYSKGDDATQYSPIGQYWDGFIGTFVSPSDTLAQWVMAAFAIGATVVLVFTLRSANRTNAAAIEATKAALDSNQIMRNEQRPWLDFEITDFGWADGWNPGSGSPLIHPTYIIKNHGRTPATDAVIEGGFLLQTMDAPLTQNPIGDFVGGCIEKFEKQSSLNFSGVYFPDAKVTVKSVPMEAYKTQKVLCERNALNRYFSFIAIVVYTVDGVICHTVKQYACFTEVRDNMISDATPQFSKVFENHT